MRSWLIALVVLAACAALRAEIRLEPGNTCAVNAEGKTSASYAVYLPGSYSTNKLSPLLFAFDSGGSGMAMVEAMKSSAEKVGWVVVGCHQLRNGYMPLGNLMAREIMLDARKRIPHDRRREYVGGVSGGAMRAYWYTRLFWDEFAGVVAVAGWLGMYDRDFIYPSRLAVAMLDGDHDEGVNQSAPRDTAILERFGVRVKQLRFTGGHQMAPPETISGAMEWLEADWKRNGETNPLMREGEAQAQRLIEEAENADRQGQYSNALQNARDIVLKHAWTSAANRADELIGELAADPSSRAAAFPSRSRFPDSRTREILLARAEGRNGFPWMLRMGRWELALAADPRSAQASAGLALALAETGDAKLRDLARAEKLALYAAGRTPEWWFAWHVLARVEAAKGGVQSAVVHEQHALELAPRSNQGECEEAFRGYQEQSRK